MADLATLGPASGVALAFMGVIGYLLKANSTDRSQAQQAVDKAEARADAMSKRLQDANTELDLELSKRRKAEDNLARCARAFADLQFRRTGGRAAP